MNFNRARNYLEEVTIPFLKSENNLKDFSQTIGLSNSRVSEIIKRDLRELIYSLPTFEDKLFHDGKSYLKYLPKTKRERRYYLKLIEEDKAINLSANIKKDNGNISDLTVDEFIALTKTDHRKIADYGIYEFIGLISTILTK